jgi:agmatinase
MSAREIQTCPIFLGLEPRFCDPKTSVASIIPVPYDGTSTFHKGADRGPRALLEASQQVELYDIETNSEMYRRGIATLPPVVYDGPPETLAELVEARVEHVLESGQAPVVIGGEHSVSIGAINAAVNRHRNLSVLQIDAHGDTRESYMGSTHNHACVMARARERCQIVQVGIRAIDAEELKGMDRERVFFAHDIVRATSEWMDQVVELLTDDVYITIDLDGFDPSLIPATGTPEPGGLDWYTVNELLRRVIERRKVRAFDVVELLPLPGEHASPFIAAKLIYRILSMMFAR